MKRLVMDLDDTLTIADGGDYREVAPRQDVVERLRDYRAQGFEIVLHSARNMRTYDGKIGKINIHTLPVILDWLERHAVPYDEVILGKPWCGHEGFYVDDKAVRPDEFARLSYAEIRALLGMPPLAGED